MQHATTIAAQPAPGIAIWLQFLHPALWCINRLRRAQTSKPTGATRGPTTSVQHSLWLCWRALDPLPDGTSQREHPEGKGWLAVQTVDGYQPSSHVQVWARPEAPDLALEEPMLLDEGERRTGGDC